MKDVRVADCDCLWQTHCVTVRSVPGTGEEKGNTGPPHGVWWEGQRYFHPHPCPAPNAESAGLQTPFARCLRAGTGRDPSGAVRQAPDHSLTPGSLAAAP